MELPIETAVRICPVQCDREAHCVHPNIYNSTILLGNTSIPVNHVLPSDCCQNTVFTSTVSPLLNFFFEGCDVSVVTMGQSGTGKSYTLLGPGLHCALSESEQGIIPRFVREVFTLISRYRERSFVVHVAWSQIAGETVQDLLDGGSIECASVEYAFQLIQLGMSNVGENVHTLFTVTLDQQWVCDGVVQHRISTASFADLSCWEKVLIVDGVRSVVSDSGMSALLACVSTLSEPYNKQIPYNQSVLTTLLKDSFGGRAKTLVICCVSPLLRDFRESLCTLQFALRAQTIRNLVTVNSFTTFENASDNLDIFELQFAANQLLKLVSNAEELFQNLVANGQLQKSELEQISRWLMLKQECEECLSESSEPRRSLERIDEEEPEDSSESSDIPEDTLLDRLELLMLDFKSKTDDLIENIVLKETSNCVNTKNVFSSDLSCYEKQIDELKKTIKIKHTLYEQLNRNKEIKVNAKEKIEEKCRRLESDFDSAQALAKNNPNVSETCQLEMNDLEEKLKEAEIARSITQEEIKKIAELERSLQDSYKQLNELKKCKRKEEERLQEAKRLKFESKTLINSNETKHSQTSQTDMTDMQALVLHRNCDTDSSVCGSNENCDFLREEIRELRKNREHLNELLEKRCRVVSKSMNEEMEEKKLLQLEEAVEAIDLAIEYKNRMICGRLPIADRPFESHLNLLIDIVSKLSENEMRFLLQHYYEKIINLRSSSKKLEMQIIDFESQNDTLACRIQNLRHALKQVRLQGEQRIVSLQQQHEDKLHVLLRQLTNDGGEDGVVTRMLETSKQAAVALQVAGASKCIDKRNRESNLIARFRYMHQTVPRQLQYGQHSPQAKVTRQKSKIIIQSSELG